MNFKYIFFSEFSPMVFFTFEWSAKFIKIMSILEVFSISTPSEIFKAVIKFVSVQVTALLAMSGANISFENEAMYKFMSVVTTQRNNVIANWIKDKLEFSCFFTWRMSAWASIRENAPTFGDMIKRMTWDLLHFWKVFHSVSIIQYPFTFVK